MNNSLPQVFVGIDVGKNFLDVHVHPIEKSFRVDNNPEGIKKLIKMLSGYQVERLVCEASGNYEAFLLQELRGKNYSVWRVDAKRVRHFRASEGIKAKTDKIDAKIIALFASQKQPEYQQNAPSAEEKRLKALSMRRSDLVGMIVKDKNRLKHPQQIECREEIQNTLAFLQSQLKDVEGKIEQIISKNSQWMLKADIIASIPGVGNITARALVAEMPELGMIEDKQIASLLGVAPFVQQSGNSNDLARIKGGRALLRSTVYMAAISAIRFNPRFKAFYERLRQAGKKAKVAIVAVMRKIIVTLNIMLKRSEKWCVTQ